MLRVERYWLILCVLILLNFSLSVFQCTCVICIHLIQVIASDSFKTYVSSVNFGTISVSVEIERIVNGHKGNVTANNHTIDSHRQSHITMKIQIKYVFGICIWFVYVHNDKCWPSIKGSLSWTTNLRQILSVLFVYVFSCTYYYFCIVRLKMTFCRFNGTEWKTK